MSDFQSFHQGGAHDLVVNLCDQQTKAWAAEWPADRLSVIHTVAHIMQSMACNAVDEILRMNVGIEGRELEVAGALLVELVEQICANIGSQPGVGLLDSPIIEMKTLAQLDNETGAITWLEPASFIEGPVPDLPKEE